MSPSRREAPVRGAGAETATPGGAGPVRRRARRRRDEELEELLRFVRDARGFDFTGYKRLVGEPAGPSAVPASSGFDSLAAYRDLLEADVDEFTTLFNTVLINLTGFFRDPAAWRYLEREIVPEILVPARRRPADPDLERRVRHRARRPTRLPWSWRTARCPKQAAGA